MKALKIFAVALSLFALLALPAYATEALPEEPPPVAEFADPESIPQFPPKGETSSEIQQPPASEVTNEPAINNEDVLAIRGYASDIADSLHKLVAYTEFLIFGVFPITLCVAATFAGCIWFRKTFATI